MASRRKREAPPARAITPRMDVGPTGTPHLDGRRKDRRRRLPGSTHPNQRRRSKRVNGTKWRRR